MITTCKQVQDHLLLYVESEQSGQLELHPDEMNAIANHLHACSTCQAEKTAIERNLARITAVSIIQPNASLAKRCLPNQAQPRSAFNSKAFKLAGTAIAACLLLTVGYLAGGLNRPYHPAVATTAQVSMNILFDQQNELIAKLEAQIKQTGQMPETTHGVSLIGLKQSAHLVKYLYEANSPNVVVSESIRRITEQNIQLLESVTTYLSAYESEAAMPMQDI